MFGFEQGDPSHAIEFVQDKARSNRRRFADILKNGYVWRRRPLPSPGADAYVFSSLALPEFSPIGRSTMNAMQFRTVAPTLYAGQAVPTVGLGGLQQGQIISGPLLNPTGGQ